jgi:penicillin amidase
MKPRKRTLLRGAAVLTGLLAALAAFVAAVVLATVPPLDGRMAIAGLSGGTDIIRDDEAVPHIFAPYIADAYTALGFVHAQDRLFQMDLARRAAQGRLSEVFGPRMLDTDILLRTLDFYGHAERSIERLAPQARSMLEAYARGVNAFMQRRTQVLEARYPPEFLLLRYHPEPWRPADCVAVLKMMALTLGANLRREVSRLIWAAQGMTPAEIEDLLPTIGADEPPPLPDLREIFPLRPPSASPRRTALAWPDALAATGASNNWVVAGRRTASGAPLLGNDPHLGLSAPSIWYLVHLSIARPGATSRIEVAGASLPGTPLIPLGRGTTLAWGATNAEVDAQDLYIERLNPQNPEEYLTPEGWQRFEADKTTIKVRNGRSRTIERRRTRHGPVLPPGSFGLDDILPPGYVAALRWTALDDDDRTIEAGLIDQDLRTVDDYIRRMSAVVGPVQNFAVADTQGTIAIISPGRIPVRSPENQIAGRAPVPGWEAKYDWQGFIPPDQLPRVIDPSAGAAGTANSDFMQRGYPLRMSWDWDADYRQRRIQQLVVSPESGRHDVDTMRNAQLDDLSLAARELKPLMIEAARRGGSGRSDILEELAAWSGRMSVELTEPVVFMAWMREAIRAVYADDLGVSFGRFFVPQAPALVRLLSGKATGRDWCDNRKTEPRETCDRIMAAALDRAIELLEVRYGSNRRGWRWGEVHPAVSANQFWSEIPLVSRLSRIVEPGHGGPYTLNRASVSFAPEDLFQSTMGSSYRAIYDLSDLDRSLYIQTTGQSGNPFSRYFRTFSERWARGDYIYIPTARKEVERRAIGTWRLEPRP